jgi:hypothetical protein
MRKGKMAEHRSLGQDKNTEEKVEQVQPEGTERLELSWVLNKRQDDG